MLLAVGVVAGSQVAATTMTAGPTSGPHEVGARSSADGAAGIGTAPRALPVGRAALADAAGSGGATCSYRGSTIACHIPDLGWWNPSDDCYWNLLSPQPPAADPLWLGNLPADGDLYRRTCRMSGGLGIGVLGTDVTFSSGRPPGWDGNAGPLAALLQVQALISTRLLGPDVRTAPPAGAVGLVGLPVWMWQQPSPLTWGPVNLPLGVVDVHALGAKVDWYMGDGTDERCTLGTPYRRTGPATSSPDCGHVYQHTSAGQPGGVYQVAAAATWNVSWRVGADTGALTVVRVSRLSLRIEQLQVVDQ